MPNAFLSAVERDDYEIVNLFFQQNAATSCNSIRDSEGRSALHIAVSAGHKGIKLLRLHSSL